MQQAFAQGCVPAAQDSLRGRRLEHVLKNGYGLFNFVPLFKIMTGA